MTLVMHSHLHFVFLHLSNSCWVDHVEVDVESEKKHADKLNNAPSLPFGYLDNLHVAVL